MKLIIENARITENNFKRNEDIDALRELELTITGNTTLPKDFNSKDNKIVITVNLVLGNENTVFCFQLKVKCIVRADLTEEGFNEQSLNKECQKLGLEYVCKQANDLLKVYGEENIIIPAVIE